MRPEFGIFEPVFASPHGYLALLGLGGSDADKAVALVRNCCANASNPFPDICRLLDDTNWRPHLVAAVAVIVSGFNSEAVARLWKRVDCGSWVTPQITTALFLIDPEFESQARARLEAKCPVNLTEGLAMTPAERHSATGPEGTIERSAKTGASLLQLVAMLSPMPDWVQEIRSSNDLQFLLARDIDNSDGIALHWLNRIQQIKNEAK